MARLQKYGGNVKQAQFYSRADNLWQYTEVVIKRLGGLSTRLDRKQRQRQLWPRIDRT